MSQTLGSDWRSANRNKWPRESTLHAIQWHRIILDVSPASPGSVILCLMMVPLLLLLYSEPAGAGQQHAWQVIKAATCCAVTLIALGLVQESHIIKAGGPGQAQACCSLQSERR